LGGHSLVLFVESFLEFGVNSVFGHFPFFSGISRFGGFWVSFDCFSGLESSWGWTSSGKIKSFRLSSNGNNECDKCEFHF
jgi:hypothetical protein